MSGIKWYSKDRIQTSFTEAGDVWSADVNVRGRGPVRLEIDMAGVPEKFRAAIYRSAVLDVQQHARDGKDFPEGPIRAFEENVDLGQILSQIEKLPAEMRAEVMKKLGLQA